MSREILVNRIASVLNDPIPGLEFKIDAATLSIIPDIELEKIAGFLEAYPFQQLDSPKYPEVYSKISEKQLLALLLRQYSSSMVNGQESIFVRQSVEVYPDGLAGRIEELERRGCYSIDTLDVDRTIRSPPGQLIFDYIKTRNIDLARKILTFLATYNETGDLQVSYPLKPSKDILNIIARIDRTADDINKGLKSDPLKKRGKTLLEGVSRDTIRSMADEEAVKLVSEVAPLIQNHELKKQAQDVAKAFRIPIGIERVYFVPNPGNPFDTFQYEQDTGICTDLGGKQQKTAIFDKLYSHRNEIKIVPVINGKAQSPLGSIYILETISEDTSKRSWIVDLAKGGPVLEGIYTNADARRAMSGAILNAVYIEALRHDNMPDVYISQRSHKSSAKVTLSSGITIEDDFVMRALIRESKQEDILDTERIAVLKEWYQEQITPVAGKRFVMQNTSFSDWFCKAFGSPLEIYVEGNREIKCGEGTASFDYYCPIGTVLNMNVLNIVGSHPHIVWNLPSCVSYHCGIGQQKSPPVVRGEFIPVDIGIYTDAGQSS